MLTDLDKRAAKLAVSKYGVDRDCIELAARSIQMAKGPGPRGDLLSALVRSRLLSPAQADALRLELDRTVIDPKRNSGRDILLEEEPAAPQAGPKSRDARAVPGGGLDRLGSYRILRTLGEGGMGTVYLGYEEARHCHVAIKVLPDHLASNQSYVDRFYREAQSVLHLNHPNIVGGIAMGQDPTTLKHYLVLEYVDGQSLHRLLERFKWFSIGDAVHIAIDIARALEHAQSRNIVHRDIKPANILLTTSGLAKLVDLGLAKRVDEDTNLTGARQGFGTPYYMPYEQSIDAKKADGRSDIYALGATLYHLVTGQVPFTGATDLEIAEKKAIGRFVPASEINPNVPPALDAILQRMLARAPEQRYQTASSLIVDLERSKLASPVPSFVDQELALKDPVVRQQLSVQTQPTQLDVNSAAHREEAASYRQKLWYVRAREGKSDWVHSQATTYEILRRLKKGELTETAEAYSQAEGKFCPLESFPEFKAVVQRLNGFAKSRQRESQSISPREWNWSVVTERARYLFVLGLLFIGIALVAFLILSH
jgi:eukaryotic-like serine/threonine-protein kinase